MPATFPSQIQDARILVVDDAPEATRLLQVTLKLAGYQYLKGCNDPLEVAAIYQDWQPDLILLDLMMPRLDGFGVLAQLEPLIPKCTYLPILMLTADVSRESRDRALSAGVRDFLVKPFDHNEALLRIRNLLETRFLHLAVQRQNERLEQQNEALQEQMHEVTLRRRESQAALDALQTSEERLRLALESAHLGTWDWNIPRTRLEDDGPLLPDNTEVSFTSGAERFNGSYESFLQLVHPQDRDLVSRMVTRSARECTDYEVEFRMPNSEGEVRWMVGRGQTFCNDAGEVVRTLGVVMDITERRRSEERLQLYAERLRNLLEIDRAILEAQTPKAIAEAALGRVRPMLALDWVGIAQFDPESGAGLLLAAQPAPPEKWGSQNRFRISRGRVFLQALRRGETLLLDPEHSMATPPPLVEELRAEGLVSFAGVPLLASNELIGCLVLASAQARTFLTDELQIAGELAGRLAVAIRHAQLFEQVTSAHERLQVLSQKLILAQETERRTIAQELHDEIGASLTAARLHMQAAQRTRATQPDEWGKHLQAGTDILERTLRQVRDLSLDLRPSMLDDFGLAETLAWYLERQSHSTGITINFRHQRAADVDPSHRLPAAVETAGFRIAQEALTNVARHARARHVEVTLAEMPAAVELTIEDDGVGFVLESCGPQLARFNSLGLAGMEERSLLAGGCFEVDSRPGAGTKIRVRFPISGAATREG